MSQARNNPERYQFDDLVLDAGTRKVMRGDAVIELPKLSFDLLLQLARAAPNVVSVDELIQRVWGEVVVSDETVIQRVKMLRDALGKDGDSRGYIETVRSVGYRLEPAVTAIGAEPVAATESSRRPWWVIAAVVVLAAGIAWFLLARDEPAKSRSIAVLPFVALSSGEDDEFFADGVTEEVLNALARLPEMLVTARTSAFYFKGRNIPVEEIAGQLGVANILEGSVRRNNGRLRITAQLIRAEDGFHLWSETFEHPAEDEFAVQTAIAENVASILDVVLDEAQRDKMRAAGVTDPRAFIAYQKGLQLFEQAHGSNRGIELLTEANAWFDQAIELAPQFADAYVKHADLYSHILISIAAEESEAGFSQDDIASIGQVFLQDFDAAIRSARDPEHRAILLLDQSIFSGDWRDIGQRLQDVIGHPTCINSTWLETAALPLGYAEASTPLIERWLECDPLNYEAYIHAVRHAFWLADFQRAYDISAKGLQHMEHPLLRVSQAVALLGLGRYDDVRALIDSRPDDFVLQVGGRFWAAAGAGDAEIARDYYEQGDSVFAISPGDRMAYLALMGDRDAVNAIAAVADRNRFGHMVLLNALLVCYCGATFDLEHTPNFARMLDQSGLQWPPRKTFDWPLKTW